MKRLKYKILCGVAVVLICIFPFATCGKFDDCKTKNTTPKTVTTHETINDTSWNLEWKTRKRKNPEKWKLINISATYSTNERTSEYFKELANKLGDSSVYITHEYSLIGTPIGDDWFSIEITETIVNGWDSNEIFSQRTTRYDEKLVFSTPIGLP